MKLLNRVLLIFVVLLLGTRLIADEVSSPESALVEELIEATRYNDIKAVKALIAAGVDVNGVHKAYDINGIYISGTALMFAAERDYINIVQSLIAARADVNAFGGTWGHTALMLAAEWSANNTVIALIAAGADVDAADRFGVTALMTAVEHNNINAVRALIAAGANVDATNCSGKTALELAERLDFTGIVHAIKDPQEDLNDQLVYAAQYGNVAHVKALIAAGANVDAAYRHGNACYRDCWRQAQALEGDTALMLAAKHGKTDTVKFLIAAGSDVDAANSVGTTALLFAAKEGRNSIVKAFIAAGANVNAVNRWGETANQYLDQDGNCKFNAWP